MNNEELNKAYDYCLNISKQHYENFPVLSLVFSKKVRRYMAAIYAFARIADDYADQGDLSVSERLDLLKKFETNLQECYEGNFNSPLFAALHDTVTACHIPINVFKDLIKAMTSDVTIQRYEKFSEIVAYSYLSAVPIVRMVLYVNGITDHSYLRYGDNIAIALQLTNFWQDISEDNLKNRIYIPQELLLKYHLTEDDILKQKYNDNFRNLMQELTANTRDFYGAGKPFLSVPDFRIRTFAKFSWFGGHGILNKIEKVDYNVFKKHITYSPPEKLLLLIKALVLPYTIL